MRANVIVSATSAEPAASTIAAGRLSSNAVFCNNRVVSYASSPGRTMKPSINTASSSRVAGPAVVGGTVSTVVPASVAEVAGASVVPGSSCAEVAVLVVGVAVVVPAAVVVVDDDVDDDVDGSPLDGGDVRRVGVVVVDKFGAVVNGRDELHPVTISVVVAPAARRNSRRSTFAIMTSQFQPAEAPGQLRYRESVLKWLRSRPM